MLLLIIGMNKSPLTIRYGPTYPVEGQDHELQIYTLVFSSS